ncbi:DUF4296 domain-containing protein [Mucilaginibacter sp. HD30]
MRRHLILFFSALFLFMSCKQDKTPGDIIEKDKMVHMLSDVHIINGSLSSHVAKDSLYKYGTNRYGLLFKKYGVDSALFNKSVAYYAGRPDEMTELYDSVTVVLQFKIDSLSEVNAKIAEKETKKLRAKFEAEKKRKADSLRLDSTTKASKAIKLKLHTRIQ